MYKDLAVLWIKMTVTARAWDTYNNQTDWPNRNMDRSNESTSHGRQPTAQYWRNWDPRGAFILTINSQNKGKLQ